MRILHLGTLIILMALSSTAPAAPSVKPTAIVVVRQVDGLPEEFSAGIPAFAAHLRASLSERNVFEVANRTDTSALVDEQQFSEVMSSLDDVQEAGKSASAAYVITVRITEMLRTGVKQGSLRFQVKGRAVAEVLDTERATALASTHATIAGFYASASEALEALASDLAAKISSAADAKSTVAETESAALDHAFTILRVRSNGEVLLADEGGEAAVGSRLTVYKIEEYQDPRHPGRMLVDEVKVGSVTVVRRNSGGFVATPDVAGTEFQSLMIARNSTDAVSDVSIQPAHGRDLIAGLSKRPTISIGKFRYSNEFDLSQTVNRNGKTVTTGGTGQGSGAVLGALGGALEGGKPTDWAGSAAAGAVAGQIEDNERQDLNAAKIPNRAENPDDEQQTAIGKESQVLRELVVTKVQKSGRFRVVELTRKHEVKSQMDNDLDGDYAQSGLIARGQMQSARFSAFGTLTRFSTERKQGSRSLLGGTESLVFEIALDLRLVDNASGAVIIADQVTESVMSKSKQSGFLGFGSASEKDGVIGELLDALARSVVAKIATTLTPITVVSVNAADRMITVNYGEVVLEERDRLTVFANGDVITDVNGEVLGVEETNIGEVQVVNVYPRFSKCRIIVPTADDTRAAFAPGQICRQKTRRLPAGSSTYSKGF